MFRFPCFRFFVVLRQKFSFNFTYKAYFFTPYFSHCQYPRACYCQYLRVTVCIPVSTVCMYTLHIIHRLVTVFIRVLRVPVCITMSTVRFHVIHVLYISPCDCQHPLSYICLYVHVSLSVLVCPC